MILTPCVGIGVMVAGAAAGNKLITGACTIAGFIGTLGICVFVTGPTSVTGPETSMGRNF